MNSSPEDLLNEIDMDEEFLPWIIVEGKDDIKFYENIIDNIERDYEVKAIEFLVDYSNMGNCDKIVKFTQKLLAEIVKREEFGYKKYFLGIIDGDARKQKGKLPSPNCLLYVLQYYSWESYFINQEVIKKSIKNFLKTRSLLTTNIVNSIYNDIEKHLLDELWFCGLKRLRDYEQDKICNKDNSIDRLHNDVKFIKELKDELEEFATKNNFNCNRETLLEITKGKWALSFFIKKYLQALKRLPILCKYQEIKSCDYCKEEDFDNCLYELNAHYREEHIRANIINLIDLSSLTPIKERIKQLKQKVF